MISKLIGLGRGISFPLGRPPKGTCEFATENCLIECGGRLVNFKFEEKAYEFFQKESAEWIVAVLLSEVTNNGNKILTWFPESGECPSNLTDKLIEIMTALSDHMIQQNGFTRNYKLWDKSQGIDNMHLALTEENDEVANKLKQKGLVAVPNYIERRVKIYNNNIVWICGGGGVSCGCGMVEYEDIESDEDCVVCMRKQIGCFCIKEQKSA